MTEIINGSYIGQITTRDKVGLAGRDRIIWNACPVCKKEKWSSLSLFRKRDGEVLCQPCIGKRTVNQNNLKWWNEGDHKADCQCARCKDQTGKNNPMWNGGKSYQSGYIAVKVYPENKFYEMADSKGYIFEHRLVMAQKLDRPLVKGETVHHINGNKKDNRYMNLELWFTNHGHGVRILDMLDSWVKLYNHHCPECKCGEKK